MSRQMLERLPGGLERAAQAPGGLRTSSRLHLEPSARLPASVTLAGAFTSTVLRYAREVFPLLTRELACWRVRGEQIPDPALRRIAAAAAAKRGNMEGAALFAVLAPPARRVAVTRALVAFQSAYNYLDALAEQAGEDAEANARQLHAALLAALDHQLAPVDYYARCRWHADGGYLQGMVQACRASLRELPSYPALAPRARAAAGRIVEFQSLNLNRRQGGQGGLERWAREQTPPGSALRWWETAASAGSSLAVHALIASAADPGVDAHASAAIERAYWPWIGALHSLLDSLVDLGEDRADGHAGLLSHYDGPEETALGLSSLAAAAASAARALPSGTQHEVILTAMASHYLSAPELAGGELRAISGRVAEAAGPLVPALLPLFRAGRLASGAARSAYARRL
jgi:tetraprenyl-beta-curcumene synthase